MALLCKIELSQTEGLTMTVLNKDGKITQTAKFNGTSMVLTCQGEDATSTITQTSDSITVKCKEFTVDAENITCKSSKESLHEAQGTYTVKSTDNTAFSSSADFTVAVTSKLDINAADISATAKNTAKLTALTTTINGDQKTNVTGMELALSAQTNASLQGATVKVAAQTTMDVEGLTTTVKGQLTNIQGALVKLG